MWKGKEFDTDMKISAKGATRVTEQLAQILPRNNIDQTIKKKEKNVISCKYFVY